MEQNFDPNSQNPNQQHPQTQPTFQQPHSLKKPLLIGLLAFVVLLGGYTALARHGHWWPFQNYYSDYENKLQTASNTQSPGMADISNWKTYTNKQYGVDFKYPLSWESDELDPNKTRIVTFIIQSSVGSESEELRPYLFLDIDTTNDKSIDDHIKNLGECGNTIKELNVAGYKAIAFGTCGPQKGIEWLIGNQIYHVGYVEIKDDLVFQILSTFKFISKLDADTSNGFLDSTQGRTCGGGVMARGGACPVGYICKFPPNHVVGADDGTCIKSTGENLDWKNYFNDQYSFEFKYPSTWTLTTNDDSGSDYKVITRVVNPSRAGKQDTDIPIEQILIRSQNIACNGKSITVSSKNGTDRGWREGFGGIFYRDLCFPTSSWPITLSLSAFDKSSQTLMDQFFMTFKFTK